VTFRFVARHATVVPSFSIRLHNIYSRVSEKLAAECGIGQWASKRTLRPSFTAQVQYYQFQKLILPSRILSYRENEPQCVIKTSKSGHLTDP